MRRLNAVEENVVTEERRIEIRIIAREDRRSFMEMEPPFIQDVWTQEASRQKEMELEKIVRLD